MSGKGEEKIIDRDRYCREILAEREQQDEKWGEQNHPDGTGYPAQVKMASETRLRTEDAAVQGRLTWDHILMEEVAEARAESDPAKLREELVQVAAVAMAWIEAIDRRKSEEA